MMKRFVLILHAGIFLLPLLAEANGWPITLARNAVAIHSDPDRDTPTLALAEAYDVLRLVRMQDEWSEVRACCPEVSGFVPTEDIVVSRGLHGPHGGTTDDERALLEAEIAAEHDPVVASWLAFFLGFHHWHGGAHEEALAAFGRVAREAGDASLAVFTAARFDFAVAAGTPAASLSPYAFIAQAKIHAEIGDLDGAIDAYGKLLEAYPGFELPASTYYPAAIESYPRFMALRLRGDSNITNRIEVLRELRTARGRVENLQRKSPAVSSDRRAAAWYELALAEERRVEHDPPAPFLGGTVQDRRSVRDALARVLEHAPDGDPGARAAFRLIELSEPYEWEGQWSERAAWTLEEYGGFLRRYPDHELAGDALFHVALATWAAGGYPQVYGLVFAPSFPTIREERERLDQWFPSRGSGLREPPQADPAAAHEAAALMLRLIEEHRGAASWPKAHYYLAVIYDHALDAPAEALRWFRSATGLDAMPEALRERATARIAALEGNQEPAP